MSVVSYEAILREIRLVAYADEIICQFLNDRGTFRCLERRLVDSNDDSLLGLDDYSTISLNYRWMSDEDLVSDG